MNNDSIQKRTALNHMNTSDFIKLEYESGITIIERLNNQKLSYQKLYIALITVIGSVSIALLKIQTTTNNVGISLQQLIGFLLLLIAILGFSVIRNMSAARRNSVFWAKNLKNIRFLIIQQLNLPQNYPMGHAPKASDRTSSDYITIFTCSIVNLFLLVASFTLLFYDRGPLQLSVTIVIVVVSYIFIYSIFIDGFLKKEDKEDLKDGK
jgi:hypothetical protein